MIIFTEFTGEFSIYSPEQLTRTHSALTSIKYVVDALSGLVPSESKAVFLIIYEFNLAAEALFNSWERMKDRPQFTKMPIETAIEYRYRIYHVRNAFSALYSLLKSADVQPMKSFVHAINKIVGDYKDAPIIQDFYVEVKSYD